MPLRLALAALFLVASIAPHVRAERALSPEMRAQEATHVLTGTVKALYARKPESRAGFQRTEYVVEIEVEAVEKGEGVAPKDLAYVRCHEERWMRSTPPPPGSSGHRPIPAEGSRVRAFVVQGPYSVLRVEDRGMTAVFPTGFDVLPAR